MDESKIGDEVDPDVLVCETHPLEMDEDIYAVAEFGAEGKLRYRLDKIHGYLYTAGRTESGECASSKAKEEAKYSGGLRNIITGMIQVRFVCVVLGTEAAGTIDFIWNAMADCRQS